MKQANILPPEEVELQKEYMDRVRARNEAYQSETGRVRKAYVLTFGCQQNEADSEKLAGMAKAMGYEIVSSPEDADLIAVKED